MQQNHFYSRAQLDTQLAEDIANILQDGVEKKGEALLVVSGGSTPLQLFRLLSQKVIPWQHIKITLADERWVAKEQPDSNEKLVRESLLINEAEKAQFIPLKNSSATALEAEPEINKILAMLDTFDVVILGMGADGHTASLFPEAVNLEEGLDLNTDKHCLAVDPITAPHQRMSMTLARLLDSQQIIIHIVGKEKRALIEKAVLLENQKSLPISVLIYQKKTPVTLYWSK